MERASVFMETMLMLAVVMVGICLRSTPLSVLMTVPLLTSLML